MAKTRFEKLKESLEIDPPMTKHNKYFLYGSYDAFYRMDEISLLELDQLREKLGLSSEDVDDLSY